MAYLDKIKLAQYTRKEDWLNSISHMVGGGLSIVALILCLIKAYILRRWDYAFLSLIYSVTMIGMYTCSSVYHALRPNNGKKAMRMVDHSMIFPMIAGTFTPYAWLIIRPVSPTTSTVLLLIAWITSAVAIALTMTLFNQTKALQMVLYLAMGWMVVVCIKTLWVHFNRIGFWLLVAGGIAYTLGAIIYGMGKKHAYFHSVFHFFVLAGSILHFFSIFMYVFV